MTVLITGGAGYIGSHTSLALRDAGEELVVIDDLSTGFDWALAPGTRLIVGDIGDETLVERTLKQHKVKSIIHFAAKTVVPESVAKPLSYYLSNTAKSRSLIDVAVRNGVESFIFSSTAAVYGDVEPTPVGEDKHPNPVSPYGRSKLMTEWMLTDAASAHGMKFVVLRYFNVAGADPNGRSGQSTANATHLVKVAVQAALGIRSHIGVYGTDYPTPDGTCLRDYIQVSDLAAAHLDALRYLRRGGDSLTLNCGYGKGHSVLQVIDTVKEVSGIDLEVRYLPRRPGDPTSVVAKADRIRTCLGWKPRYDSLTDIVAQALHWERIVQQR